jgi:hypothetical protein
MHDERFRRARKRRSERRPKSRGWTSDQGCRVARFRVTWRVFACSSLFPGSDRMIRSAGSVGSSNRGQIESRAAPAASRAHKGGCHTRSATPGCKVRIAERSVDAGMANRLNACAAFLMIGLAFLIMQPAGRHALAEVRIPVLSDGAEFVEREGGMFWLGTTRGIWRPTGPTAEPQSRPLVPGDARFVRQVGNTIWLGTGEGIWRLRNPMDSPEARPFVPGLARFVSEVGGFIWLGTSEGIWRLPDPGAYAAVPPLLQGYAQFVREVEGALWLGIGNPLDLPGISGVAPGSGIWRLLRAFETPAPQALVRGVPRFVTEIRGTVWLGTAAGIWALRKPSAEPIALTSGEAQFVVELSGKTLFGTSFGVWRSASASDPLGLRPLITEPASFIKQIGGVIWIGTGDGIWRLHDPNAEPEFVVRGFATLAENVGGVTWLGTTDGIWRVPDPAAPLESRPLLEGHATFAKMEGGAVWLALTDPLASKDGRSDRSSIWILPARDLLSEPELFLQASPIFVETVNGIVWVGTTDGIWRMEGIRVPESRPTIPGYARFAKKVGDFTWLGTGSPFGGILPVVGREDAGIWAELNATAVIDDFESADSLWKRIWEQIFPTVLIEGPTKLRLGYDGEQAAPLDPPERHFSYLLETDPGAYRREFTAGEIAFVRADQPKDISQGSPDVVRCCTRQMG